VNISGGTVGFSFSAFDGSEVNISGGSFDFAFDANDGSQVNISGGTFGPDFDASSGSTVNLFVNAVAIDGVPMENDLVMGEAFAIENRDQTLSGVFVDGTPFSFDLNSSDANSEDFFSSFATLTVTLGLPASEIILGDCDQNGEVNFFDIAPFIEILAAESFLEQADCDQDGDVDFFDIFPFIETLAVR